MTVALYTGYEAWRSFVIQHYSNTSVHDATIVATFLCALLESEVCKCIYFGGHSVYSHEEEKSIASKLSVIFIQY
jgi:hypothetical protein